MSIVILGGAFALPYGIGPYWITVVTTGFAFAVWALGLDILLDGVGLLSFGHALWLGGGGYIAGEVAVHISSQVLVALSVAAMVSAIAGLCIGAIITKAVGVAFSILTLVAAQIAYEFVQHETSLTGGDNGLVGIPVPRLFSITVASDQGLYAISAVALAVAVAIYVAFRASRIGREAAGIRENEGRMVALGYNVRITKTFVCALSGMLGGLAGALLSLQTGSAAPSELYWTQSGVALLIVVIGGSGTIVGPVLAAIGYEVLSAELSSISVASWQIPLGIVFVAIVIVAPEGLGGVITRWNLVSIGRRLRRIPSASSSVASVRSTQ